MNEFWVVMGAVLPVFCITGAGFAMRRLCWLTEEADQSMLRVTINLLVPGLIFDMIIGNRALERPENVLLAPVIGIATVALSVWCSWLFRKLAGAPDGPKANTFAFTVGIQNYGYLALPLAILLYGQETVGVLFVHNMGVETALWTLGLIMLSGGSLRDGWRKLLNPPIIAIATAVMLNFAGGSHWLPEFLLRTAKFLGQCAIPMGLILIGATIADLLPEFHAEKGWRLMFAACFLRLGLFPILFVLLARYLPCSKELKQVLIVQGAMPSAVFPIVMSRHYGGDTPTALRVVMGTTAVGLITIPFWIRFGIHFAGL